METTPILFTGENCPKCDEAKGIIENRNLIVDIQPYDETKRVHRDLRIMGVPTIIILNDRYVGQDALDYLNKIS